MYNSTIDNYKIYDNEKEMTEMLKKKKVEYVKSLLDKENLEIEEYKIIDSEFTILKNKKSEDDIEKEKEERKKLLNTMVDSFVR